jgi:phenylalanyl-tRNA synthetase alpha chain
MKTDTPQGTLHPLTLVQQDMVQIFSNLGFTVATGPEMEDEWHNFDALNVPAGHPARDMQDTFWIRGEQGLSAGQAGKLLRTHTSPVQIRYMQQCVAENRDLIKNPIAIICPGKVFRNEATDATHEMQFHQMEGLLVGENISMAHLKGVLLEFFKQFIGEDTDIRLRPSFFPFVEPGLEVDVKIKDKWVEVLGAGLVNPKVLQAVGLDPEKYSGFAFGMGIDRLATMKFGIPDVRLYYQGDARLNQF